MAKKTDFDVVKTVVARNVIDPEIIAAILRDLSEVMEQEDKEERPPAIKKQHVILVSDPEGRLEGLDLVGWALQIPEDASPFTVHDRIGKATALFHLTPKGRRLPIQTVGEALECVPAKFFKEAEAWIKTKEPVLIVPTGREVKPVASVD